MYDLSSGLPFHWILNGLPYQYPVLEEDLRCEVLVVGSGITGALCAHACMKAGLGTVVVDARPVGTGSTAASTALLQYELDTPLHVLAERIGEADAIRTYQLGIEGVQGLVRLARSLGDTDTRRRKSLQFASKRSHASALHKEYALRTAHGMQVEPLAQADTEQRTGIRAESLLSHDGAEMDPYAFTHRIMQDVIRMGGAVYDRTRVTDFEQVAPTRFEVRTADGHRITARHLIMATGYESQRHLSEPVMDLHSTYAVISERTTRDELWYEDCLIWETARPYLYMRTTPDRRVIVGGLDEPFRDPKRRDALLPKKTRQLTKAFHHLLPSVPFEPEYTWCGTFGSTKDGLPYFDRDPRTGAWFVLGMGGNGIVFSWIGARIVRDAILGKTNPDARLFRFDR